MTATQGVGYEQPFLGLNAQTTVKLALVGGIVIAEAARYGVPWIEVQPTEAKQSLTGDDKADKQAMIKMAQHIFGLSEPPPPHIADAIGITFFAEAVLRRRKLLAQENL